MNPFQSKSVVPTPANKNGGVKKSGSWRRKSGLLTITFFVSAWLAYFAIERFDHQVANLVSGLFAMLATLAGGFWVALRKSIPNYFRLAFLAIPVVGVMAFLSTYEFSGFSGELVPRFRPRKESKSPSKNLVLPDKSITSLETDKLPSFRQFLGNERVGFIKDMELSEAWDREPPNILWRQPIGLGWSGFAIQDGLAITMEEFEDRDCLVAFDWNNGGLRWRTSLDGKHFHALGGGGPCATPTIEGDRFYSQSSTGIVSCAELSSGTLIWQVDLLKKAHINKKEAEAAVAWGRSGSPLLYEDMVIVPFGGALGKSPAGLIALDRLTGEERWRGGNDQISYASPVVMTIQGVEQIVMVNEATATGHEAATGKVMWSYDWPGQSNGGASVSQPVSIDQELVLLSKGYGGGALMLDFSKSTKTAFVVTPKWKNASLLKTKFTSAIFHEGYLYGLSDGILECVRAEDGKRMWKDARNGRMGHGQLLVVGKHLLISSEDGRCILGKADPDSFHKLGELPVLTGITWNTLAIAGNRVYMRNGEQAACIELQVRSSP